jgi:hypothetical protein
MLFLGVFALWLDAFTILLQGNGLWSVTFHPAPDSLPVGKLVVFAVVLAVIPSYGAGLLRGLTGLTSAVLAPVLVHFMRDKRDHTHDLEDNFLRDAITTSNSVAYQYCERLRDSRSKEDNLRRFCAAFLVASALNLYLGAKLGLVYIVGAAVLDGRWPAFAAVPLYWICLQYGVLDVFQEAREPRVPFAEGALRSGTSGGRGSGDRSRACGTPGEQPHPAGTH